MTEGQRNYIGQRMDELGYGAWTWEPVPVFLPESGNTLTTPGSNDWYYLDLEALSFPALIAQPARIVSQSAVLDTIGETGLIVPAQVFTTEFRSPVTVTNTGSGLTPVAFTFIRVIPLPCQA